ncbi:glycosyltransferase [Dyadobacter chenhuakuii]|uniref:Glycosyltransferase n=1 Tax=Dyadobacter chenhuakuii TaxID=2909339 RepID=A0ABY4XMT2_9BACT|nr:glycosyltransferase [Dyadobacter chenhuakuii]MCF2494195.1 glycosyltransferase [Dyadobacter chenhuakuii]USJ31322.1 glycosyltransferase [Dyadobacter chenhuakuii]
MARNKNGIKSMMSDPRRKILYVHHSGNLGGAPRSLSFLIDKVDKEKYDVSLLCIANGPGLDVFKNMPINIILNEKIFPFHGSTVSGMTLKLFLNNFVRIPQSFIQTIKVIKEVNPSLIHLNSSSLFIVAMAAKFLNIKIKTVCHIREPLLKYSISALLIKYFCYFFVDYFIAIDSYSGASMKVRDNMKIIYNAVNFEQYNPLINANLIREELSLPCKSVLFLYLARYSSSNGTKLLVKAAKKLTAKYPNFHFVLAGLKDNAKDRYTLDVVESVKDNGQIHLFPFRSDVPQLIASSDIMVVPFKEPHFARSIVEACAIAKPSIGANVGGVNELIIDKKTGLLYNTLDELCICCEKLGTDVKLRKEMGNEARKIAVERFDNAVNSRRVFNIYDELI